jgi:hypothetical protein
MRIARTVAKVVAVTAFVPSLAFAQAATRPSNDAWFWGVKGGAMIFKTGVDGESMVTAPSIGAEWFLTRTHIALNVSVEQSFFDDQSGVFDATVAGSVRPVDISDWRRYAATLYFLPANRGALRPYAGLGMALNVIQNATPVGQFTSEVGMDSVFTQVNRFSSRASVVLSGGAQYQIGNSAVFGHVSAMPTRSNFLVNGSAYTFMFEAGVRYNVGSALEKIGSSIAK